MNYKKVTEKDFWEIIKLDEINNICFYWIDFSWYDFSRKNFIDCKFEKCNLSNLKINNATFNNVLFFNSKIMWLNFSDINSILSHYNFNDCIISLCYFNSLKLSWISFEDSEIKECDFTKTELIWSNFIYTDLEKTIFSETNLKKANFRFAINFSINPNINNLEKTKFSPDNVNLLLNTFDIIIE